MRGSLITFVIVIISASIMVNLTRSILTIAGRGSRLDERRAAYEEVAAQHAQLERKLIEVQNPQYIEKVAREKLGLTQPGEQIVLLPQWVVPLQRQQIVWMRMSHHGDNGLRYFSDMPGSETSRLCSFTSMC